VVTRQDCQGRADLERLQSLAQRVWTLKRRFHVGDIAWGWHSTPDSAASRVSMWQVDGVVLVGAWVESPGHLDLIVDPAAADLVPRVLDWFETVTAGPTRTCLVMQDDHDERAALAGHGYTEQHDGPFFRRLVHDLTDLPAPPLPTGFTLTQVSAEDADRRAAAHRAGWSDFASQLTADNYRGIMATYPYREQTDLVVAAPDGQWVASALGWYDEINQVGLVEPVSCTPAFRRRGLAAAVNIALLHAFRTLGATHAVILPRGDPAYPAPARLYQAIGYRPGPRTLHYTRH
jgi:predicted N-acetyltransferase YhbS